MAQTKITGDMIADDAVTTALIADDAVTTALIADDAVTTALIADDQITTALIADDQITTALIADGAITAAKIAAGAIPAGVDIQSSAPSVASEGSLYYNTTADKLYLSNGTAWLPLDTNAPPVPTGGTVTIPTQAGASTFSYNLGLSFTDEDVDANLTYTLESGTLPAGAVLPTSGNTALTGTATNIATTTYNFVIRATDAKAAFATQAFTQVITNTLPTATGGTVTIAARAGLSTFSYNLGLNFSDVQDTDAQLTYTLASGTLPAGAVLPTSGNTALTGTATDPSTSTTYNFVIRATNTGGLSATQAYTQTIIVAPTGGTITTAGGYRIHTFTSSGTFVTNMATSVDFLVIAGGGAGGGGVSNYEPGSGGGAGGYRTSTGSSGGGASAESSLSVTAQSYSITVGAGGAGAGYGTQAGSGGNSVLSTITSLGGGGGGSYNHVAQSGGSGAGGAERAGKSGTTGQGTSGGSGNQNLSGGSSSSGGGGGGALYAGTNGGSSVGGNGGVGNTSSITGTSVVRGGGGAGGGTSPGSASGGGGASRYLSTGYSGTANTGGGGGGPQASIANGFNGGNGGSGIVIIRYAV
jgi:hypothetical protein